MSCQPPVKQPCPPSATRASPSPRPDSPHLLVMRAGVLESISHDDVASMLGLASTKHDGKKLELVFLSANETEGLGKVRHIAPIADLLPSY